ncbi:hypothetical protein CRENBAI_004561 [Crenichthys baileyi]|uniref:Tetraspanin n=1 Tax=Crenichthys baileyi TaxID=28760 RepID=A0AAV9SE87_9TELE
MKPVAEIRSEFIVVLDKSGHGCKYILIVFNIIFAVVGFTSLVFGLWLNFHGNSRDMFDISTAKNNQEGIDLEVFEIAVYVLVILGLVMVIVGSFGDYAACSEKKMALQVFSVLLFLLAMAEITVGLLAYFTWDEIAENLGKLYADLYKLCVKNKDKDIAGLLTFIHSMLHCCGLTGVQPNDFVGKTCLKVDDAEHSHMQSCRENITTFSDNKAPVVLGCFVGTGAILIGEVICTCLLALKIHRDSDSR